MVRDTPRAALPGAAPPDPGPGFTESVAGLEGPDRIRSLLNSGPDRRQTNPGRERPDAIAGYFRRHIVPAVR